MLSAVCEYYGIQDYPARGRQRNGERSPLLQVVTHFNQIGVFDLRRSQLEASIYLLERFSAPEVEIEEG